MFYLSNFPKYLEFFDPANEKLLAKWKIYTKENRDKFSGLKSKMRCILSDDGKESNTAKGVKIGIELFEYKDILFNKEIIRHKMKRIQSKKHETRTYWVHKISLSCFGDKRYTLDYGVHTLAYFHKDLKSRFLEILTEKKRFSEIRRDSHRQKLVDTDENKLMRWKNWC